jgi:hypothetical protein
MQNAAAGDASIQSADRMDGHHSIVSDLLSLIEHVQASIALIEGTLAREAALGNADIPANVVVLDDVTPRYMKTSAALSTCRAGLGVALHVLLDVRTGRHGTSAITAG